MSVRLSELHDPVIESTSPKEGVNALRARFERFGQSDNMTGGNQNYPTRSSPPLRPITPPARKTQGPARPPPPKPSEKPRRPNSDIITEPVDRRQTRTPPVKGYSSPDLQEPQHPLAKVKSRSVGDLKVIREVGVEQTDSGGVSAPVQEITDSPSPAKKGKKGKNKTKSKGDHSEESSGSGKKFWRLKGTKSVDVNSSPKSSPEQRKASAPAVSPLPPLSSPSSEPPTPSPESFSSSEADSSKEGTPNSGRRKSHSGGKKSAVRKSESSLPELSASREKEKHKDLKKTKSSTAVESVYHSTAGSEEDMASPHSSPGVAGRKERRRESDVKEEARRIRKAVLNAGLSSLAIQGGIDGGLV